MALLIWFIAPAQQNKITESKPLTLAERFMLFDELSSQSVYSITIAADVPDNKRPMKVYYKKERHQAITFKEFYEYFGVKTE